MEWKLKNWMGAAALFACVISSSGCFMLVVGAAAGVGGVVWANGSLQQTFDKPLYKLHAATLKGLQSIDLPVLVEQKENLLSKFESEFSDEKHIWITLKQTERKTTELSIRVGAFGDELRSQQILDAITKAL